MTALVLDATDRKELLDRFVRYVQIDTQSDENSTTSPSTEKQKDLGRLVADELRSLGCEIVSPRGKAERSGILCFRHPAAATQALFERLMAARIVVSLRAGAIRLSPHFYNSEGDVERMLDLLKRSI